MAECAIALPETVNLDVPYLSQQDNVENPGGSCNVTSCSMVLQYFGKVGTGDGQLEDQLYRECLDRGLSRHDPYDLAKLLRLHGVQDDFRTDATWEEAKRWLAIDRNPLIAHGYFTRSGHIIVIRGYNEKGFIVNDPWGEWWRDGYDKSASGEGLTYSYEMMEEVCAPDRQRWLHFCSK